MRFALIAALSLSLLPAQEKPKSALDKTQMEAFVRHLLAVQSQDYPAAKWALGLRLGVGTVESDVDRAYDELRG